MINEDSKTQNRKKKIGIRYTVKGPSEWKIPFYDQNSSFSTCDTPVKGQSSN